MLAEWMLRRHQKLSYVVLSFILFIFIVAITHSIDIVTPVGDMFKLSLVRRQPSRTYFGPQRPTQVDRYVALSSGGFPDGRGLGNQMFDLATVLYVAELTGRRPAWLRSDNTFALEQVFGGLSHIEHFDDVCPCHHIDSSRVMAYDSRFDQLNNLTGKSITLSGFFQTAR